MCLNDLGMAARVFADLVFAKRIEVFRCTGCGPVFCGGCFDNLEQRLVYVAAIL